MSADFALAVIRAVAQGWEVSHPFMRALAFLVFLLLMPFSAFADVQWHEFDIGGSDDKETIVLGHVTVAVELQKSQTSGFPDDLVMTVKIPGQESRQYDFTSTYGYGAVAVYGDMLLLKYGVGRGTFAREDHVKAMRLNYHLTELMDVTSSSYVLTNPHNAAPNLFEYQLKIQTGGGYTTFIFKLPKPQRGIPSEKIVRIKDDA